MVRIWIRHLIRNHPSLQRLAVYWRYRVPELISRFWHARHVTVIRKFPAFAPMVTGPYRERGLLTIQSANQTFPFLVQMIEILGKYTFSSPRPIQSFSEGSQAAAAAARLKALFDKYGSDKARAHNYHHLYGYILNDNNAVSHLLEIGLGTNDPSKVSNMGKTGAPGASLRAFRDFLPGAMVHGADIDSSILFEDRNIKTYVVDQTDLHSLDTLSAKIGAEFDIIIDDGLHAPFANIASLSFALKNLKRGGWFVVEDISVDALPIWRIISALLSTHYTHYLISAQGALVFAMANRSPDSRIAPGHP